MSPVDSDADWIRTPARIPTQIPTRMTERTIGDDGIPTISDWNDDEMNSSLSHLDGN
jgi:hypothetical protein